jgi:hypothetical protein
MAQQLLDTDFSLLFIADGSIQPEQEKAGEWQKRLKRKVDEQLQCLKRSDPLDEHDQDVGLCSTSAIKQLQCMYATQNNGNPVTSGNMAKLILNVSLLGPSES